MYMSRKVKSVSFDLQDPIELKMFEEISKLSNFSGHIKYLLMLSLKMELPMQPVYNEPTKPSNNLSSKPQIKQEFLSNLI
jgi:hypothetical protein